MDDVNSVGSADPWDLGSDSGAEGAYRGFEDVSNTDAGMPGISISGPDARSPQETLEERKLDDEDTEQMQGPRADLLGDWDEILNLEARYFEEGRREGLEIGAAREQDQARITGEQKGAEFGLELGFYIGVVETLLSIQTKPEGPVASAFRESIVDALASDSGSNRVQQLAEVYEKLAKPNVSGVLSTLTELLDDYPVGAAFTDDVHAKFLRIRAKFKVLEARVGLTFDITPNLDETNATSAQGSALDAASLEF